MKPLFIFGCFFLASGTVCSAHPIPLPSPFGNYCSKPKCSELGDYCPPEPESGSSFLKTFSNCLQIGGNYTRINLKPHGSSTFHGNLGGIQGIYEYRPMNRFYGAVKFAWREGDTHGHSGKRSLLYADAQERLGYTFGLHSGDWGLTLFSGFGYRHNRQRVKPKEGSKIKFNYNEFYLPVGILSDYALSSWFSLGLGVTWMPQLFPTVGIKPLKGARWDLTYELANFLVELPFTFSFTSSKRWALVFKPFYERWQDGHTFAKTSSGLKLDLPGNTYNFWGADLNLAYSF